ncbi:MAG: hypothetical protein HXS54_15230, partial [Theionarchaea archaeon]|nr:hypothetical protein [Theionarchaea archaeon]
CVRSYEKGSSGYVENAVEVALHLLEKGIMPYINILVGHPREASEDTMRALEELAKVTTYIKQKGYPVSGLNASVFHFNYPSKMYGEFLESGEFDVVYHDIQVLGIPEKVLKVAERIPLKAVRRTEDNLDKCSVSDKIYTFWSSDDDIIEYMLKTLEKYAEPLFDAWMRENVVLVWEGSLKLESITTESERIVKTIIEEKRLNIRELVWKLGYTRNLDNDKEINISKETKNLLWAVIFMLYGKRVLNILPS